MKCLDCRNIIERDNKKYICLKTNKELPALIDYIDLDIDCKDFEEVKCPKYVEVKKLER